MVQGVLRRGQIGRLQSKVLRIAFKRQFDPESIEKFEANEAEVALILEALGRVRAPARENIEQFGAEPDQSDTTSTVVNLPRKAPTERKEPFKPWLKNG